MSRRPEMLTFSRKAHFIQYTCIIPLQGFVGIVDHAGILVSRQRLLEDHLLLHQMSIQSRSQAKSSLHWDCGYGSPPPVTVTRGSAPKDALVQRRKDCGQCP